jgi:hypothetical protein
MRRWWMFSVAAILLAALTAQARAQDTARGLLERAVHAHGGAAQIDKRQAVHARAKSTLSTGGLELPVTQETFIQLPDKFKITTEIDVGGLKTTMIQVLNGDKAWVRFNDQVQPANDDLLNQMREMQHLEKIVRLTPLLRDRNYELELLPETRFDDKPYLGLKVSYKGRNDVKLFFDKTTGMLTRTERRTATSDGKEVVEEQVYSEFKDVQGSRMPMKILILQDGKKFLLGEMIEVKPLEKLEDSIFERPEK